MREGVAMWWMKTMRLRRRGRREATVSEKIKRLETLTQNLMRTAADYVTWYYA
ncbi:hypothetical protein [Pseudomonas sp. Xaverov 259]|uniref:hypothetical protein n=1 Tax=Pseudomonas sp. Xaverov 259 TaxID=2666086 RepID=UPI001C5AC5B8|nr:hypothetical protein [Pseudomonas sp. Xaverov 259]